MWFRIFEYYEDMHRRPVKYLSGTQKPKPKTKRRYYYPHPFYKAKTSLLLKLSSFVGRVSNYLYKSYLKAHDSKKERKINEIR